MPPPHAVALLFFCLNDIFSGTFIEFRAGMLNISPIGRLVDKFARLHPFIHLLSTIRTICANELVMIVTVRKASVTTLDDMIW
jgi:hypothetical protein